MVSVDENLFHLSCFICVYRFTFVLIWLIWAEQHFFDYYAGTFSLNGALFCRCASFLNLDNCENLSISLIECLLMFSLKCFVVKTHERQHKKNQRNALSSRHAHSRVCVCVFAQLSIILRLFAVFIPNSSIHSILCCRSAIWFFHFMPIHWTSSSWISIKKMMFLLRSWIDSPFQRGI